MLSTLRDEYGVNVAVIRASSGYRAAQNDYERVLFLRNEFNFKNTVIASIVNRPEGTVSKWLSGKQKFNGDMGRPSYLHPNDEIALHKLVEDAHAAHRSLNGAQVTLEVHHSVNTLNHLPSFTGP